MKTHLFSFLMFIVVLVAYSCTQPSSQNSNASTDQFSDLKGQSAVVDEESEPHILNIAIGSVTSPSIRAKGLWCLGLFFQVVLIFIRLFNTKKQISTLL